MNEFETARHADVQAMQAVLVAAVRYAQAVLRLQDPTLFNRDRSGALVAARTNEQVEARYIARRNAQIRSDELVAAVEAMSRSVAQAMQDLAVQQALERGEEEDGAARTPQLDTRPAAIEGPPDPDSERPVV